MILIAILACEVAFWVAIVAGLAARYLANRPRLGAILLACAPAIDLLLLALVTVDLLGGGTASWHHGLAALYIGISIAYGHRMTAWADQVFAVRFKGATPQTKPTGWAYTRLCWFDFLRTTLAAIIASGILFALIWLVDAPARTAELSATFSLLGVIIVIDLIWAISYTIWPKQSGKEQRSAQTDRS